MSEPLVGVAMGSNSDWSVMQSAAKMLRAFGVRCECRVISAHRAPDLMYAYAKDAKGLYCAIIAGAGGAAHLLGMLAALTTVPVLGVPIVTSQSPLQGIDSLLSIVQMPIGTPVATMAMGIGGATNAALFVVAMLASSDPRLASELERFRGEQESRVKEIVLEEAS